MVKNDYVDWDWFKELIHRLRKMNIELMEEQGGGNQVMLSVYVDLIDYNRMDWVSINPHSMNLHTGKGQAYVDGKWKTVNVKELFYLERLEE